MVRLTVQLFGINHKRTRFIDSLRLYVRGGSGGAGFPKFGGIGGKGGDIYVTAESNVRLRQVRDLCPSKRFLAGPGEASATHRILGRPGTDVTISCPVGVSIMTDQGRCLCDLDKPGQSVRVARGGEGGNPHNQYHGQKGQAAHITMDLKIIADIGFVGFPNAGKSTLLKALSRASPKIANYPFTTLRPNIGIMQYEDLRQISLADLPGLIEGAHMNYGLGHTFLKHVTRTKLLLFVVDVQGFSLKADSKHRTPLETIMLLNKELELYQEDLVHRPAALVVTKSDTSDAAKKYEELIDQLKNIKDVCQELPDELRPSELVGFDCVLPICSQTAHNISNLKDKLRSLLDFYADQQLVDGGTRTYIGSIVDNHELIVVQ